MSIKSYTRVIDNKATFDKIQEGVETIANAVASTLGPWGRTVIIEKLYNPPHVTKDGVTVANEITLRDQTANLAVEILRQAAQKTASEAGDGTTSTIVMTSNLVLAGYKYCKEFNITPSEFKAKMESIVERLIDELYKNHSTKINGYEDMYKIALVSSNNDDEISDNVAKAFDQIGEFGVVTVNQSNDYKTTVKVTDAIRWDKSHPSPLLKNKDGSKTVVNEPAVLVTDLSINDSNDIVHLVKLQRQINKPLVVICDDIVEAPLEVLTYNVLNNGLQLYILRTPYIAQAKTDAYVDLATITGAVFVTKHSGFNLADSKPVHLGSCDKVEIDSLNTYLFGRHGKTEEIQKRIDYYNSKLTNESSEAHLNYRERLGQLTSGSAVINIGGTNEVDIREKYDRYDDTISAVRAAIKKGYCNGAGSTYTYLANVLETNDGIEKLMIEALFSIRRMIEFNKGSELQSFNAIDPCLVIENVIRNSVGAALLLITSGYSIIKHNIEGDEQI